VSRVPLAKLQGYKQRMGWTFPWASYARGLDGLWGVYQWLDRASKGRNETDVRWRRHDEYEGASKDCCA
jgi:predicted dithiol-disulfide oxidoreductase (DUF899 family)